MDFSHSQRYIHLRRKKQEKKGENESKKYIMKIKTKREIVKNM